ncbi:MAG: PAS domain-containing protein [Parachlamydiaceae bacterium]|nr:PAS domain-containing protein [Parachlamydiaceae bacterium]
MKNEILRYFSIAQAIEALLHPYAELVIHDLKTQKIVAIINNYSKRKVGDDSLLEKNSKAKDFPDYFEPYFITNWDGRKLKSTTATLRDSHGKPIGLLCINLDISKFEEMKNAISLLTNLTTQRELPAELFNDDWREKISQFVQNYLRVEGKNLKALTKLEKKQLINLLHDEGAFKAKNAASYIGDILDISRATVYKYLAELNQ